MRTIILGILALLLMSGCDEKAPSGPLTAKNDTATVVSGGTIEIDVLANDKHKNGLNILIKSATDPKHGSIAINDSRTITYTSNGDFVGPDSFKYIAVAGDARDATFVDIEVTSPAANIAPTANAGDDQSAQVDESITITGSGNDTDGDIAAYKWEKGTTKLATSAEFVYTPTEAGTDTLKLTVTDNDGATGSDEMKVTVTAAAENHKPVANAMSIDNDSECGINAVVSFTVTGSDEDAGDTLTFSKVTDPAYGSVVIEDDGSGEFKLDDSEDQNKCMDGLENSFTFKANDGTVDSDTATVTINPVS